MSIPKYVKLHGEKTPVEIENLIRDAVSDLDRYNWYVEPVGKVVTNTDGTTSRLAPARGILDSETSEHHFVYFRDDAVVIHVQRNGDIYDLCTTIADSCGIECERVPSR